MIISDNAIANRPIPGTTNVTSFDGATSTSTQRTSTTTEANDGTSTTTTASYKGSVQTTSAGSSSATNADAGYAAAQMLLKELIAHLQQMLAKVDAQIAAAAAQRGPGGSPNPVIGTLQAEASAIQGQISAATAKMLQLGKTIGGIVNDQA